MKKVVVGLSGGVDSSVSALLLKQQGFDVVGIFMQNWDPALNNDLADPFMDQEICQAEVDFKDAKAVADKIGIPIHRVNFVQEYWDKVFKYFIEEYKKARTPNPDIFCNKYIKFKAFMDYALDNFKCDYIAMGHYAQVQHGDDVRLIRGIDLDKDQTYFLEQLSQYQLSKTLFPIGHLQKSQVRNIAQKYDLITANKKDSTGICFIGERNFAKFLTSYIKADSGDFVDIESNKFVAKHKGLIYYTIGQRRGLGIGGNKEFKNSKWYVVSKDVKNNIVYVSQDDESYYLKSNMCIVSDVNFIANNKNEEIKTVKFRYRSKDVIVINYEWINNETIKIFYDTHLAVTPGQACVFYQNDYCLGGGEIKTVFLDKEERAYENWDNN